MASVGGPERSLARKASGVAGTRVVVLGIGVLVSVILARVLGPAGRGEYAFLITVSGTAFVLAHMSVEQAQVFLVSRGASTRALASNALVLATALGLGSIAVVTLLCAVVGWPAADVRTDPAWVMVMLAVPVSLAVLYLNGLLTLEGRTDLLNRAALFGAVVQCSILGLLALTGHLTVPTVIAVWLFASAVPLLVSVPYLRPRLSTTSRPLARRELSIGVRYHPGMAGLYLLLRVDVFILAALGSEREVGLYALAVSLAELTNVATDSVATAVLRRQSTSSLDESAELTARLTAVTSALAAGAVIVLCAAAPLLIPTLFGSPFSPAVSAVLALAPGVLALAAGRCLGTFLIRLNRPLRYSGITATALLINVLLNFALIPRLGIVGAGLASSVAYVIMAACMLAWFRRATRLPWSAYRVRVSPGARPIN